MNDHIKEDESRRRKRTWLRNKKSVAPNKTQSRTATFSDLPINQEDPNLVSLCQTSSKRRKRPKTNGMNSAEECGNITSSNYPRVYSAKEDISCNWKTLCQKMNIGNSPSGSGTNQQTRLIKKAVSPKSAVKISHSYKRLGNEIWFDGVDKELLEPAHQSDYSSHKGRKENGLVKGSFNGLTSAVAMDCEMVGIGQNGIDSILARVSIVNLMGNCIYDKYVKNTEPVTDYRTAVSGIRPSDLEQGEDFKTVQNEVSEILDRRILVGHAVQNDLKVLFLTHPRKKIRDTSTYYPFRNVSPRGHTPSLKMLAEKILGVKVQEGEHSSVQDAQAAMRLYTMHKIEWENAVRKKYKRKNPDQSTTGNLLS